jgi:hypothetical protein
MDMQTALTVAGITATVVFGVWAIVIAIRYNRSVSITYAEDQAIALTDDITQNFPDLRIMFRGQPVSENLVLLKGYFINTGRRDITREMVEEKITLSLPEDFEWVECRVVESSPSLKASVTKINNGGISVDTGEKDIDRFRERRLPKATQLVGSEKYAGGFIPDNTAREQKGDWNIGDDTATVEKEK